jgi:hypothetical protein
MKTYAMHCNTPKGLVVVDRNVPRIVVTYKPRASVPELGRKDVRLSHDDAWEAPSLVRA